MEPSTLYIFDIIYFCCNVYHQDRFGFERRPKLLSLPVSRKAALLDNTLHISTTLTLRRWGLVRDKDLRGGNLSREQTGDRGSMLELTSDSYSRH